MDICDKNLWKDAHAHIRTRQSNLGNGSAALAKQLVPKTVRDIDPGKSNYQLAATAPETRSRAYGTGRREYDTFGRPYGIKSVDSFSGSGHKHAIQR